MPTHKMSEINQLQSKMFDSAPLPLSNHIGFQIRRLKPTLVKIRFLYGGMGSHFIKLYESLKIVFNLCTHAQDTDSIYSSLPSK